VRYSNEKNIPRSSQPRHSGHRDTSNGTLHAIRGWPLPGNAPRRSPVWGGRLVLQQVE
jgi:hypothetical protein